MRYSVEKSVQSRRDIEEAFVYIAERDLDVGVTFLVAVEDSIDLLKTQPHLGSKRRFENTKLEGVRVWQVSGYKNHLILYRVEEKTIKIMRIVNVRQDFDLLFDL